MPVGLTTIRTVDVGATVSLDGRSSRDADGDRIAFRWSLISVLTGSSTQILEAAIATPTFVVDVEGTYVLQLVVNDGEIDSLPDTVVIAAVGETPLLPITLGGLQRWKGPRAPCDDRPWRCRAHWTRGERHEFGSVESRPLDRPDAPWCRDRLGASQRRANDRAEILCPGVRRHWSGAADDQRPGLCD